MFGSERRITLSIPIFDPGQDSRINILKVPAHHTYTVENAEIVVDRAINASTANYVEFNLENAGTSGTAQSAISDTIGGTAAVGTAPAWAAQTPKSLTIVAGSGDLAAGEYLALNYSETGTIGNQVITVLLDLVDGVGANA